MFENEINKTINKIEEEQLLLKQKILVRDIIDIYNHKYSNYNDYRKEKQNLLEAIKNEEEKQMMNIKENNYCIKFYVHPVIIEKEIFDYAFSLGETINVWKGFKIWKFGKKLKILKITKLVI